MQEIDIGNFNEMVRYEKHMDSLRALALWISQHDHHPSCESAFGVIKDHSLTFAADILNYDQIPSKSLESFQTSMKLVHNNLGITEADVASASQQQKDCVSGFWEIRRVIGQFGDAASEVAADGVSHIIAAGVSGCIIAEYLALLISANSNHSLPVDHMVFSRSGREPSKGILKPSFKLSGRHPLLVDDAVMETTTIQVMLKKIKSLSWGVEVSLLTVDMAKKIRNSNDLSQFRKVYLFEE